MSNSNESLAIIPRKKSVLIDLAVDIADGLVFTNRHLGEDIHLLFSIFVPLSVYAMNGKITKKLAKSIGIVYEYVSKHDGTVNGYPQFTKSCYILNQDDSEFVIKSVQKCILLKSFMKKDPNICGWEKDNWSVFKMNNY